MLEPSPARSKPSTGADSHGPITPTGLGVIGESDEPPDPKRLGGLVLSRRLNQAIVIGVEVEIQVVDLKANAVRLKIIAPRSIAVHRLEVYESIRSRRRPAAPGDSEPKERPTSTKGPGGLVLTRHIGERIMVGDEVEVEVADIRSGAVRLRFTAPREIAINRREVHDAIRRGDSAQPDFRGVS